MCKIIKITLVTNDNKIIKITFVTNVIIMSLQKKSNSNGVTSNNALLLNFSKNTCTERRSLDTRHVLANKKADYNCQCCVFYFSVLENIYVNY